MHIGRIGPGATASNLGMKTVATSTTTVSNTTTETNLISYTIPANTVTNGMTFRIFCHGTTDNIGTASGTLIFKIRVHGGTPSTGAQVGTITVSNQTIAKTEQNWSLDAVVTFRGAASSSTPINGGGFFYSSMFGSSSGMGASSGTTRNMTTDQQLAVTCTWQTADAGNICRILDGYIELIKE